MDIGTTNNWLQSIQASIGILVTLGGALVYTLRLAYALKENITAISMRVDNGSASNEEAHERIAALEKDHRDLLARLPDMVNAAAKSHVEVEAAARQRDTNALSDAIKAVAETQKDDRLAMREAFNDLKNSLTSQSQLLNAALVTLGRLEERTNK